ncbi:MAG: hypothetical protein M1814_003274 [Vezdaea aestivalis]|nr:MAG: hypothetical protein M1814_003274 [Vezdaea aestivalis]
MSRQNAPSTPPADRFLQMSVDDHPRLPDIEFQDTFVIVVIKVYKYIFAVIDGPHTFEQLRTSSAGRPLKPLAKHLSGYVYHPALIAALLAAKGQFSLLDPDDRGVNKARAWACEIVAWRLLAGLSKTDVIEHLLYGIPSQDGDTDEASDTEQGATPGARPQRHEQERRRLLEGTPPSPLRRFHRRNISSVFGDHWLDTSSEVDEQILLQFIGLNALEIAAVVDAKKFLSQPAVQTIINEIWKGDIIFWESLSVHTKKKAQFYNKKRADPFCRLRVPRYQKYFEVLFFATFLVLYYAVVVERDYDRITPIETLLYIWVAAFAYDEFSEFRDAGRHFYAADFWSIWDIGIIMVGIVFMATRVVGIIRNSYATMDIAFDILSLEALFLVPRLCSLLSLHPYFGTLIPCLKEMTKDFCKYLGIVVILYLGFLTTFTLLGRTNFTLGQMAWLLVRVFFGSGDGFAQMYKVCKRSTSVAGYAKQQ